MSGSTVIAPNARVVRSRFALGRGVVSDLVIAIAVVWALPLLLAAVVAVVRLLLNAM